MLHSGRQKDIEESGHQLKISHYLSHSKIYPWQDLVINQANIGCPSLLKMPMIGHDKQLE